MYINGVHYSTEEGLKVLEQSSKRMMQKVIEAAKKVNIDEDLAKKYGLTLEQIKEDPSIVDSPKVQEQIRREEELRQAKLNSQNINNNNFYFNNNSGASVMNASFQYGNNRIKFISASYDSSSYEGTQDVDEVVFEDKSSYNMGEGDYDIDNSLYYYGNHESEEGENMYYDVDEIVPSRPDIDDTIPYSMDTNIDVDESTDLNLGDMMTDGVPGSLAFMNMFPGCFNSSPEGLAKLAEDIEKAKRCVKVVKHDPHLNDVNNNTSTSQVPNNNTNAYPHDSYGYAPTYNFGDNNTIMSTPNNFYTYTQPANPMMNGYGYNYNNSNNGYAYQTQPNNYQQNMYYDPNMVNYNNAYLQPTNPMMNGYGYNYNNSNMINNNGYAYQTQPNMAQNMHHHECNCGHCAPNQPMPNPTRYTIAPNRDNISYMQCNGMFWEYLNNKDKIQDGTKPRNIAFKEFYEKCLDETFGYFGLVIPENTYDVFRQEIIRICGDRIVPQEQVQEVTKQIFMQLSAFLYEYLNSIPLEVDCVRAENARRKFYATIAPQYPMQNPVMNPVQANYITQPMQNTGNNNNNINTNRRLIGGPHPITGRMPDGYLTPEEIAKINASQNNTFQNNMTQQPVQNPVMNPGQTNNMNIQPATNNINNNTINNNNASQRVEAPQNNMTQQPVQNPVMNSGQMMNTQPAMNNINNNVNINEPRRIITLDGPVRYINGIPIEEFEARKDLKYHSTMYTPKEEQEMMTQQYQPQAPIGYMQQPMALYPPPVNQMLIQQPYAVMPVTSLRTGRVCIDPNPYNPYATSPIYQAIMSRAPVVNLDPMRTQPPSNYVFAPAVQQIPFQGYQNPYMYNNAYGSQMPTYINPQAAEKEFKDRLELEKLKYKMVAKYFGWKYDDEKVDKLINPRNPVNLPTEQERIEIAHWNEVQRIVYYSQHQDLVPLAPHQITARFLQEKIKNFHKELDGHTMCEFFEEDYPRLMREFWIAENINIRDNRNHSNTYNPARYNALLRMHQQTNPYIQKILSQTPPPEKGEEVRVVPSMDFAQAVAKNNPEADPKAIYAVYQDLMKSPKMQDYCDEFVETLEELVQDRCTIKGVQNRAIQEKQAQAAMNNNTN